MRKQRGRLVWIAVILTLAFIAAFSQVGGEHADSAAADGSDAQFADGALLNSTQAMSPGPLSSIHAGFTQEQGCASCHAAHEGDSFAWLKAAFGDSDVSEQCGQCHQFEGAARAPHNFPAVAATVSTSAPSELVSCTACHKEHKGADALLSRVSGQACANCHDTRIHDFSTDHPAFPASYPHRSPTGVYFNHQRHLGEYFVDSKWTGKANRDAEFAARAKDDCTSCHAVEKATREVRPRPFGQVCAGCHEHQVKDAQLVMFSADGLTPLSSVLFGLNLDDADDDVASEKSAELLEAIAEQGVDALVERLGEHSGLETEANQLFAGLKQELLVSASKAWIDEEEVERMESEMMDLRGWFVGENADGNQSIFYRPEGHEDRVIRAWIDALHKLEATHESDEIRENANLARQTLLDPEAGAGNCGKCHAANLKPAEESRSPAWGYQDVSNRQHTLYSHAPHLSLMSANASCQNCHALNKDADYDAYFTADEHALEIYQSNFAGIDKQTCDSCHSPDVVKSDCQLCHVYHRSPTHASDFSIGLSHKGLANDSK